MTDPIRTPAEALEAAARVAYFQMMKEPLCSAVSVAASIRALAPRIAAPDDEALVEVGRAANMASLGALCDDLCETESATVDRRQLCEWLSAMQAQAHDIERLTRERDKALDWETVAKCNQATAQSWIARVSAAEADAAAARRSLRAALVERNQTFKVMHDRADALEAERDALRSVIVAVMGMIDEASNSPQSVDRWLDRMEEACEAALGGQP